MAFRCFGLLTALILLSACGTNTKNLKSSSDDLYAEDTPHILKELIKEDQLKKENRKEKQIIEVKKQDVKESPAKVVFYKKKRSWKDNYLGLSGYFDRPPVFASPSDQAKYERCDPVTIQEIKVTKKTVVISLLQDEDIIRIKGINRRPFRLSKNKELKHLKKHLVEKLAVLSKPQPERMIASVQPKNNVCLGKPWKNMSEDEFAFIHGRPEYYKKGVGKYKDVSQWVYKGGQKLRSYYFSQGRLYAWPKK